MKQEDNIPDVKIAQEHIKKAEAEAAAIVLAAEKEAEHMLKKAQEQAKDIIAGFKKKADDGSAERARILLEEARSECADIERAAADEISTLEKNARPRLEEAVNRLAEKIGG